MVDDAGAADESDVAALGPDPSGHRRETSTDRWREGLRETPDVTSSWWAVAVASVAVLVLVVAPARVWLFAGTQSFVDDDYSWSLKLFWLVAGLLPTIVGVVAWRLLRTRPARRRFVLAATAACLVGFLTLIPITPYLLAF